MLFKKIAKKILSKFPTLYNTTITQKYEKSHKQGFTNLEDREKEILLQIQKNGYFVIPDFVDKEFCELCIKDIDNMCENKKEFVHKTNDLRIFGAEELSENIKKFNEHKLLNRLAEAYIAAPTCCAFTLAGKIEYTNDEYGSGGTWHRDSFLRQFKSLIYLNDVTEENGPFQLIRESNKLREKNSDTKKADLDAMESSFTQETVDKILEDKPDKLETFTAKAGTVVLVDSSVIHRGVPLKNGKRYALTNYFFERNDINQRLVEHFSPLVAPEKVLSMKN